MDRRFFLQVLGCGCLSLGISSCSTVPITDRKQLKLIPESKLNAQAAQIYEKVKEKEKMSDDLKTLNETTIGDFVIKPFEFDILLAKIKKILSYYKIPENIPIEYNRSIIT